MTMPSRIASALADHYRFIEEIGAGGMGEVCLANDVMRRRAEESPV